MQPARTESLLSPYPGERCPQWLYEALLRQTWPPEYLVDLEDAIGWIAASWPAPEASTEQPVFVFSAGWRSGSTLLQRLLNSDPGVLVFGEAFEQVLLWHQLAHQLRRFSDADGQFVTYLPDGAEDYPAEVIHEALTRRFIATLSPGPQQLVQAHRAYVEALLKAPAVRLGRPRWGIKLVRADVSIARYVRWLYPQAKLLFVYRNPYEAYRSFAGFLKSEGILGFALCAPTHVVHDARGFILHWRHCIGGFLEHGAELGAHVVRYEDLVEGRGLDALEAFVDARLDPAVLSVRAGESRAKEALSDADREVIRYFASEQIEAAGY